MLISSADLLATAQIATSQAEQTMAQILGATSDGTMDSFRWAEAKLVQALCELRAARWGVERKAPQFDDRDLDILLDAEAAAVRSAHGHIPKQLS